MDDFINELQNTWSKATPSEKNIDSILKEILNQEKKERRTRIFLLIAAPLTIISLIILLPVAQSLYYQLAIVLIALAMIFLILQFQLSRIESPKDAYIESTADYVKTLLNKYEQKMNITRTYMWIYTVLLISGLNIGYIEALNDLNFQLRIAIHFAISVVLFWFMYSGIRKKIKKNNQELLPVKNKLEEIQRKLNSE